MDRQVKIIPCLDLANGRVVKGVQFQSLTDAGDPDRLAARYGEEGASEVAMLDVMGSSASRQALLHLVKRFRAESTVPLLVGGGIRSVTDGEDVLAAGATRISVASAAVQSPELIDELSDRFGSDALVISLDVKENPPGGPGPRFEITTAGGKVATGLDALSWARQVERRGAGAIMLNSISTDGGQKGFDLPLLKEVRQVVDLELIASGGAGEVQDFIEAAKCGADAVLAASVFHYGTLSVEDVRLALQGSGYDVWETKE